MKNWMHLEIFKRTERIAFILHHSAMRNVATLPSRTLPCVFKNFLFMSKLLQYTGSLALYRSKIVPFISHKCPPPVL